MKISESFPNFFFGTSGGRVLLTRNTRAFGSTKIDSGIFSSQVGFMLPIGQTRQGAYYASFALFLWQSSKAGRPAANRQ